jgi:anti-sigma factor RsiW
MSCDPDLIHDFADAALSEAARERVATHLRGCQRCRDELARILALRARVATLSATVEPARDLWPAIQAEVERRKTRPLRAGVTTFPARSRRWMGLVAAAVLLVVASSAITALVMRERGGMAAEGGRPARDVQLVAARGFAPVEAEYLRAARELAAELSERRTQLSPETVARVEASLRTIDLAIAEARAALDRDPANADIVRMLDATYRQKLDLLRRAAEMPARI